jgi:dCTP deaminase
MAQLNDLRIRELALEKGMIHPFHGSLVSELLCAGRNGMFNRKVLSFGTSSHGYDIRLSTSDFRIFRHIPGQVMDPKRFDDRYLEKIECAHSSEEGSYFILPAHSYALGVAVERLNVPRNIIVVCVGKSTYARCGVIVNVTPAEAGWIGNLTLEFSNSSDADCRIYAGEGVAQLLFFEGDECVTSYADRQGKYQSQPNQVVPAKV